MQNQAAELGAAEAAAIDAEAAADHLGAVGDDAQPHAALGLRAGRQSRAIVGNHQLGTVLDLFELHDAFTILEIVESEEVGFFKKGQGHLALERGETRLGGKLPINTSGGLKAKGHPVGATGVGQAHEIILQLRGEAEKRQVKDPKIGFTCNFGGFGNNVVCLVFKRED